MPRWVCLAAKTINPDRPMRVHGHLSEPDDDPALMETSGYRLVPRVAGPPRERLYRGKLTSRTADSVVFVTGRANSLLAMPLKNTIEEG